MTVMISDDRVPVAQATKIVIHNIACHFQIRIASWFMATMMFGIGIVLTINPTALTATPNAPVYFARMLEWGDQSVWRAIFLIIGTSKVMALVINGSFPGIWWTPHLRMVMAGLSSVVWMQVAISVAWTQNPTLGAVVYPMIFIMELYNTWRASRETRTADHHGGSVGDWS